MGIDTRHLLACIGPAALMLWTGCTCNPVYPPTLGDGCEAIGDDFVMRCDQIDGEPLCVGRPCAPG